MNPCKHHNGSSLAITNLRLLRQSGEMATRLREANHLGFDQFASVAHIGRCLQPFIGRRALKSPTRPSPDKAARSYGINAPLLLVRSLLYLDLFPATTTAIATQVGSIWIFQFESRLWSDGGLDFAPSTMADHPLGCVRSGATSRYSSHATLQRSTRDFKSLAFYFVYSDIKYLIHNTDKKLGGGAIGTFSWQGYLEHIIQPHSTKYVPIWQLSLPHILHTYVSFSIPSSRMNDQ